MLRRVGGCKPPLATGGGSCLHQCCEQASVTAGMLLQKPRVRLRTWFLSIFHLGRPKKGISALQLQRNTGPGSYELGSKSQSVSVSTRVATRRT